MQNFQFVIIRNFFENLNDIEFDDNENNESQFFANFISYAFFTSYAFFIQSKKISFSFSTFSFEIVKKQKKNVLSFFLHLALNFWFEKSKKSQLNYVRFRKILQLKKFLTNSKNDDIITNFQTNTKYENVIQFLLLKFDTFKKQVRRHISLLQLMRKTLLVIVKKMFFFRRLKKRTKATTTNNKNFLTILIWFHWFNTYCFCNH